MSGKLEIVKISRLVPSKTNPRKHFDEAGLQEMAASIKEDGLIHAAIVRPLKNDLLEIIDGERRWRASQLAGENEIKVEIGNYTDEQVLEIQMITSLQRKDLHPLEEAQGFQNMLNSGKFSKETIAEKVGKSQSYITKRLQLLKLNKDIQEAFISDKITIGHAIELARLSEKNQNNAFKYAIQNGDPVCKLRDLIWYIKNNFHLDLTKAVFNISDKELFPSAGSCSDCPNRTGFNKNLFDDIENGDICTSPECFHIKEQANIKKQITLAEETGKQLVKISTSNSNDKKSGAIGYNSYEIINTKKKTCKSAQDAIFTKVDKYSNHKPGEIIKICTDPDCKIHHHTNLSRTISPEEEEQNNRASQERELQIKLKELTNQQLLKEVIEDIKMPITGKVFELFWHFIMDKTSCSREFFYLHGITEQEYLNTDNDILYDKLLKNATDDTKLKFMLEIIFLEDIDDNEYDDDVVLLIRKFAADSCNINIKSIEKAIEKKLRAPEKKEAETKDKKPAKGKKDLKIPANQKEAA